jgi:hypothetical protein
MQSYHHRAYLLACGFKNNTTSATGRRLGQTGLARDHVKRPDSKTDRQPSGCTNTASITLNQKEPWQVVASRDKAATSGEGICLHKRKPAATACGYTTPPHTHAGQQTYIIFVKLWSFPGMGARAEAEACEPMKGSKQRG